MIERLDQRHSAIMNRIAAAIPANYNTPAIAKVAV